MLKGSNLCFRKQKLYSNISEFQRVKSKNGSDSVKQTSGNNDLYVAVHDIWTVQHTCTLKYGSLGKRYNVYYILKTS